MPIELPPDLEKQPLDVIVELLRDVVAEAKALLKREQEVPRSLKDKIFLLRDCYNELLDDDDDGDVKLLQDCHDVLGTGPKREVRCRPFPKCSNRLKCGESGGTLTNRR